jgi:adenylate cyclase
VNPKTFFAELKRRNVYKVAIAYAVVAWLLMQVASQIFPFFEIPNWAVRLVVLLLIIGFPVAVILAWAFELTPEGIKLTESADREAAKPSRNKAWIYIVIIAAALSVGLVLVGRYTAPKANAVSGSPPKSIAVLPFDNQNHDPNTDYLSDGIPESIIHSLSQLPQLRVMARSTVFSYKGKDVDPRKVGHDLGVGAVFMGRLIQQGDNLTIRTELVDVSDGTELWGQQYNRKLADLFAVQEEIAKEISEKLRLKLSGAERQQLAKRPTENLKAFQYYMQGRGYISRRTRENLLTAIRYCDKALEEDRNYALAYAGLADAYGTLGAYGYIASIEGRRKAEEAARKALALDQNLAEAHAALGSSYTLFAQGKRAEALQIIKELEEISGANLSQALWIAKIYAALNEKEMAFSWLDRGMATGAIGPFYKHEPVWDPIRSDPRFTDLLRRMEIPQ